MVLALARTAKKVIEVARPTGLRRKGVDPSIYMNGILMGGLDPLDTILINSVKEIRFLPFDAFFAFRDSIDAIKDSEIKVVIQPEGSRGY